MTLLSSSFNEEDGDRRHDNNNNIGGSSDKYNSDKNKGNNTNSTDDGEVKGGQFKSGKTVRDCGNSPPPFYKQPELPALRTFLSTVRCVVFRCHRKSRRQRFTKSRRKEGINLSLRSFIRIFETTTDCCFRNANSSPSTPTFSFAFCLFRTNSKENNSFFRCLFHRQNSTLRSLVEALRPGDSFPSDDGEDDDESDDEEKRTKKKVGGDSISTAGSSSGKATEEEATDFMAEVIIDASLGQLLSKEEEK